MTQHADRELNGYLSWDLLRIVSEIKMQLGGLETGQEMTREEVRAGLTRVHERIDNLHIYGNQEIDSLRDRVTTAEAKIATAQPERRGWIELSGLSPRELISLGILVVMSLTGTLSSDMVVAWLSH